MDQRSAYSSGGNGRDGGHSGPGGGGGGVAQANGHGDYGFRAGNGGSLGGGGASCANLYAGDGGNAGGGGGCGYGPGANTGFGKGGPGLVIIQYRAELLENDKLQGLFLTTRLISTGKLGHSPGRNRQILMIPSQSSCTYRGAGGIAMMLLQQQHYLQWRWWRWISCHADRCLCFGCNRDGNCWC